MAIRRNAKKVAFVFVFALQAMQWLSCTLSGWPDWAIFSPIGQMLTMGSFLDAVVAQILGYFFSK
jgi:hypothetical protein